jgi:hypothetical protein
MDKNHLQGLKNLRKNILNGLEVNLDENLTWKEEKVTTPNPEIVDIFEMSKLD